MNSTSILSGKKFKIQQSVPSGSIRRGPQTIMRTADLNDGIAIQRRFGQTTLKENVFNQFNLGPFKNLQSTYSRVRYFVLDEEKIMLREGSKPLFADIPIRQTKTPVESHDSSIDCKLNSKRRSSSTDTSSPERYRYRENKKHSSQVSSRRKSPSRFTCNERTNHNRDKNACSSKIENTPNDKYRRREKSKTRSRSPVKKKPVPKLPYYRDEQREKDRLKRLYGSTSSRSSPPTYGRKRSPSARRHSESLPRGRRCSKSIERHSSRRDHRRQRSRTPTRTRSPQRHEHSNKNRDKDKERKEDLNFLAAPQIIPIPVAVPADYMSYSFPGWTPPQPPWHHTSHRPPPLVPFPMWPMVPPIRPPLQASFAGMPSSLAYTPMAPPYHHHASRRYPPPRHITSNYQSRPKKP